MVNIAGKELMVNTSPDVLEFQQEIARLPNRIECPIEHDFAPGVYIRKMFIPAGTIVVGKCHRYKTYNILSLGSVTIYSGEGEPLKTVKAPYTFTSDEGVKKVGLFHEDSIWMNIFVTDLTDIDEIENHFIIPEPPPPPPPIHQLNEQVDNGKQLTEGCI